MESLSGRDKTVERLIYRLTIKKAVKDGEFLVARSPRNSSEVYGMAAWLAPGVDWNFQYLLFRYRR
ncbi:hypothetical protein EUX98_g4365 [Antrodiella citrinella]|uniref:Uncharacterized protein n=1 Tax=Antrodiella citrinella TaxID=2447956 RepID=A0A4S4MW36_9APHY|nr:hypothetical protein EUX98_g4365 [Antrodiella citrinella]